jgi:hypothetical protein
MVQQLAAATAPHGGGAEVSEAEAAQAIRDGYRVVPDERDGSTSRGWPLNANRRAIRSSMR